MVSRLRGGRGGAEAEGQQHQRGDEMDRLYGPPPAYAANGAAKGNARRCIMMPVVGDEEDSALGVVVQVDGESAVGGLDTWAETSVIKRSRVKPGWTVRRREKVGFDGLGSTAVQMGEEVEVPVQMRYGGTKLKLLARVVEDGDMPGGADILFGTRFQRISRMKYDCDNRRVELRTLGLVIDLESVDALIARREFEPLRVLELCGGMSGSYGILIDLGYEIGTWDSVESDSGVAEVARQAYPQLRHVGERVELFMVNGKYHLVLAGPPCQPWSRAAGAYAKGFRDERSKAFKSVCEIVQKCLDRNPETAFMVETVVVNKRVAADAAIQSEMLGGRNFQRVTPVQNGWPQLLARQ
jgi:hypothetical protein